MHSVSIQLCFIANDSLRAAIKCPSPDNGSMQYMRERQYYAADSINQSPYIRSLVEVIGHDEPIADASPQPQCMVYEWMDTDLWQLPSKPFRSGSPLPRTVARSVLNALTVFDKVDGVHCDVNPNNIFVSGANGPSPIVKLGDLGTWTCQGLCCTSYLS